MSPLRAIALMTAPIADGFGVRMRMLPTLRVCRDSAESTAFIGHLATPENSIAGASVRSVASDLGADETNDVVAYGLPDRARRLRIGQLVIALWLPELRAKPANREPWCPKCGDPSPRDLNCICWRTTSP